MPQGGALHTQETADERWRPILGVHSILISAGEPGMLGLGGFGYLAQLSNSGIRAKGSGFVEWGF